MDELITALMRKGRGTRMPLHHPALTAAGQLRRPRCLSTAHTQTLDQGLAAETI